MTYQEVQDVHSVSSAPNGGSTNNDGRTHGWDLEDVGNFIGEGLPCAGAPQLRWNGGGDLRG